MVKGEEDIAARVRPQRKSILEEIFPELTTDGNVQVHSSAGGPLEVEPTTGNSSICLVL